MGKPYASDLDEAIKYDKSEILALFLKAGGSTRGLESKCLTSPNCFKYILENPQILLENLKRQACTSPKTHPQILKMVKKSKPRKREAEDVGHAAHKRPCV